MYSSVLCLKPIQRSLVGRHGAARAGMRCSNREQACKDLGDGFNCAFLGTIFLLLVGCSLWLGEPFGEKILPFQCKRSSDLEDCHVCDLKLKETVSCWWKTHSVHSRFPITAQWSHSQFPCWVVKPSFLPLTEGTP